MKRMFFRLTAILLTAFFLAVPASANHRDTPPRITILGDSISEGYGLPGFVRGSGNPAIASYGNLVAKALGSDYGRDYFNLSVSGDTSADLLALVNEKSDELKAQSPDLIFITIGGNDLIHAAENASRKLFGEGGILSSLFSGVPDSAEGADPTGDFPSGGAAMEQMSELRLVGAALKLRIPGITSTFGENLSAIILALHTLAPEAEIFVQTIYDPLLCTDRSAFLYTTLSAASAIVSPLLTQMNEVIVALAPVLDYTVVDAAAAFEKAGGCPVTNILSFDIHPNEDGHALLSRLMLEAVEKIRGTDTPRPNAGSASGNASDAAVDSGDVSVSTGTETPPAPADTPLSPGMPGEGAPVDPMQTQTTARAGNPSRFLLPILIAAVTAAGCSGIVLLARRRD